MPAAASRLTTRARFAPAPPVCRKLDSRDREAHEIDIMIHYDARTRTRMRALTELRRLDSEVRRLERVHQDEPTPVTRVKLETSLNARACTRRALGLDIGHRGLTRRAG